MSFTIYYFAKIKDILKTNKEEVFFPDTLIKENNEIKITSSEIFNIILENYKKRNINNTNIKKIEEDISILNKVLDVSMIVLNDEYIKEEKKQEITIKNKDEVSIIPPVSGG